jgi:polyhydroxyalkanoate synthesis regulator phasin
MPLNFSFFQDSKKRPQSNSFLDSLLYPSIDRDQPSFNPEDVFLLPEDVNNFKKPRNIKNPITSTPPMAQSRTLTMTPPSMPTPRPSMPMNMPSMEGPEPEQDSTNFLGSLLAQGVASLGAGIQGGDIAQVGRSFEAGRQRAEQDRKAKALVDPKSEESKRRRMVFEKALGSSIPEEYSATDLNDPVVLQSIRDKKMQEMAPKSGTGIGGVRGSGVGQEKPEKKKKLGVEEAKTLFNISTAYNAIQDLKDAVKKNVNKYSIIGDNEYTESANRFKEGIGRLLSGGAIGDEEGKNFLNLIPTIRDSDETAKRKLEKMDQDLTFKYKTLGYNKEDVLYDKSNELITNINPDEKKEAIKWANENINSKDEATRNKAIRILGEQ